jgi:REP element-mobilizing transposase RayT
MPYSVDSSFKYIALHFDDNINSLVIWRDTDEKEDLTTKRIKKIKKALKKYLQTKEFEIYSMSNEQKVSRHTMNMTSDSSKIKYLLTLNSVFDISKTRLPFKSKDSHIIHPNIFCKSCWKNGFHLDKKSRTIRKMARRKKHNQRTGAKQ